MKTLALSFLVTLSLSAQTARYPTALAGDSDLAVVANRLTTKLAFPMGAADTQMIVASATGIVPNMILTIDPSGERVFVCAVAGTTLTLGKSSCPNADGRGFDGTTAAAHANKAAVSNYIGHWEFTQHSKEIQALEAALGVNLANSKPPPGPAYTAASYTFSQSPGGSLSPGNNVISVSPCPAGANGTDTGHYVALSGGTGATEGALITGGTCTSGANSGTLIVNAAGAHSGAWTIQSATGGIQEALNSLPASGGTIDVAAPVTIRGNAQITLPGAKDLVFRGVGWGQSLITSTSNKPLFALAGGSTVGRRLRWEGLGFNGGAGVFNFDNLYNNSFEFISNFVTLQTDTAIRFGNTIGSVYINRIRDNMFYDNRPATGTTPIVWLFQASDTRLENNFWLFDAGVPLEIDDEDVSVDNNYFIANCSAGGGIPPPYCPNDVPYDILITPTLTGGFGWIMNNKFGAENETAAHIKIQLGSAALRTAQPNYVIGQLFIHNNSFQTASNSTVIYAYHRCLYCVITDNVAMNYNVTWFNDADNSSWGLGDSVFRDNICTPQGEGYCVPFTNGGKGFATIAPSPGMAGLGRGIIPYRADPTLAQNLLAWSEDFSHWTATNVNVAASVTGPFGDASASSVTGTGGAGPNILSVFLASANGPYTCALWMQAGTETRVMFKMQDATGGSDIATRPLMLDSTWQRYQLSGAANGNGHYIACEVYLPDSSTGSINVFGGSGEQFPLARDYVKTGGVPYTSAVTMRTFPRLLATGVGPALTVSSNTIAPTFMMHHVGAGLIKTITRPPGFNGCITLIPDAAFTWDTSANIATTGAAASVGMPMFACFDTAAWYLR